MTSSSPRPQRRHIFFALGTVAAVALLAMAGAITAVGALGGDSEQHRSAFPSVAGKEPKGAFGIGEDVPTSFGAMSVKHAERLNGLTSRDLAGMTHGINGLVGKDKMRLQASVTLTNLLDGLQSYAPQNFTLRTSEGGKPIKLTSASIKPGQLQPDASIDARIDFTAPKSAKRFWLDFNDPRRKKPITVELGNVKELPGRRQASKGAQEALLASQGNTSNHNGHGE